ncbi:MAG: hypothetical protein ACUZ8E_11960 [Candidatus Anammoxibacter sp.]
MMTITNNYDTNKNGVDIEFNGFYDCYQSQEYFTENFETIQHESHHKTAIYFYTSCGEIKPCFDLKIKALKKDLYKFVQEYCSNYIDNSWSKEDLYNEAIIFLTEELTTYKYDINDLSQEYNMDISFVNDIEILTTYGYSQGDYALVIIDKTQIAKLWGNYPDNLQETSNHLFWDSPVSASITIDEKGYNYYEYDLSEYTWQRNKFINRVAKDSGVPESELESLIPEELSYQT